MEKKQLLVSVGIPTYNRPEGLRRTLECITRQTYKNLEIIVSDNCSPVSQTEEVVRESIAKDSRIHYFRQQKNMGPTFNFKFVLEKATGEYFMWAADDDEWESFFIEKCLDEFRRIEKECAAVIMEAQYFSNEGKFEYFEEGKPFYEFYSEHKKERFAHILKYNYGNLYYSLFRRSALYIKDRSVFDCINPKSLNEIPLFLFVMYHGNWQVIPQVGFYKKTNIVTYKQAKWEKRGGELPNSSGFLYYRGLPRLLKYHMTVLKDIERAIDFLGVDITDLKKLARKLILKHFWFFVVRHKPPLF